MQALLTVVALGAPSSAFGQSYPVKPIRIVSGFAPGGGVDIMARVLSPKLVESLGQPILIESRPGAGTNIAIEHVVKSPPDGYTLLMSSPPVAINMSLYKKLNFDTTRDLATITVFSQTPNLLVVHPSLPVRTVQELIALARAKPGALNYSYGGSGTTQHLSGELFKLRTGTRILTVPYKGTQPSMTALLGGEVELTIANIPSVIEFVKGGRLRALASSTVERTVLFPQIPTMRETGVDMVVNVWYTIHAPAATPRDIVQRLAEVTVKAARSPDMKQRLMDMGAEPVGYMPEQATRFLREEIALWAAVVKASGAQAD
jgi:tripartite-type tricarboxylate transporter receptor subunit TctC